MTSFVCPACSAESHHPVDAETGWCDACHLFTGRNAAQVRAASQRLRLEGSDRVANSILYRLRRYGVVHAVDLDDVWPRDLDHRYRVYARVGDELTVLAACPEAGGIGCALVQRHEDEKLAGRRLADLGQIGVLDVMPGGEPAARGEWVVVPFNRGGDA